MLPEARGVGLGGNGLEAPAPQPTSGSEAARTQARSEPIPAVFKGSLSWSAGQIAAFQSRTRFSNRRYRLEHQLRRGFGVGGENRGDQNGACFKNRCRVSVAVPQGLKPLHIQAFSARLKSCPGSPLNCRAGEQAFFETRLLESFCSLTHSRNDTLSRPCTCPRERNGFFQKS